MVGGASNSAGRSPVKPAQTSSLRLHLGARTLLIGVALLDPGVGMDVVPAHLPEPALVVRRELEAAQPLRALPGVAPGHDDPEREPVLGREVLPAVCPRDEDVVVHHRLQRQVRGVAVLASGDDPLRLRLHPGPLGEQPERHPGPCVVESRPARHAVHVGLHVDLLERLQLVVGEPVGRVHEARDLQVPPRRVEGRDRTVVEHGPGLHEALAGWDTLRDLLGVPRTEQLHGRTSYRGATARQAASAVSTSSSEMSRWVTIRAPDGPVVQPTSSPCMRITASSGSRPITDVSTKTMFVSTWARLTDPGNASASPSARRLARAWSSWSRFGPSSRATSPAAANTPA